VSGGEVDRRRVGEIVFESPEELAWLEAELHPRVGERIAGWRESLPAGTEVAVVEVPLLFETAMEDAFDTTVAVVADETVRRGRAEARGQALVEERAARQLEQGEKASRADHVIRNDGTIGELERKLAELLDRLLGSRQGAGGDPVQR
jgi:dephospho-CoA kinase